MAQARDGYDRVAVLQRIVADDRARLQSAITRARSAVKHKLSVGEKVADYRWAWLGAGLAVGLLLGARRA
jgi:hypothetical protein